MKKTELFRPAGLALLLSCGETAPENETNQATSSEATGVEPVTTGPGTTTATGATDDGMTTGGAATTMDGTTGTSESAGTSTGLLDGSGSSDTSTTSGSTGEPVPNCVDVDLGTELGEGVVDDSVAGLGDDFSLGCSPIAGEDHVTAFTAPYHGVFTFEVGDDEDARTAVMVLEASCDGAQLACSESYYTWSSSYDVWYPPRPLTLELDEGQTALVVVTKDDADAFTLGIHGVDVVDDESCVDVDLGSTTGSDVAQVDVSTILSFTAPETGTYRIAPSSAVEVFVAGCEASIETFLQPIDVGLIGSPGTPDAGRAYDLVAGQEIAIAVTVPEGSSRSLHIVPNASSGGTCCSPRTVGAGCSNAAIEDCVCELDGFCCGTNWDGNCSGRAIHYCDAKCIE